jgi:hypothetical protein
MVSWGENLSGGKKGKDLTKETVHDKWSTSTNYTCGLDPSHSILLRLTR